MQLINTGRFLSVIVLFAATNCTPKKQTRLIDDIAVCGTVQFSNGCSEELDEIISYGIALVHHMTYEKAEAVFDKVIETDRNCFWGPWGKALTYIHPVWKDDLTQRQMVTGLDMSQQALKLASTEKEIAYANAVLAFYNFDKETTKLERLKSFREKWHLAYEANPDDIEAKSFYALGLIGAADPTDTTFADQRKAGELAEDILTVINDHPGGFHYIIHAYDYPGLSTKALQAASLYGTIAPEIPHALHMPSHIYTRLGMWAESIEWNKRSAAASVDTTTTVLLSQQYFHALDYMLYAYLQLGQDNKANQVFADIKRLAVGLELIPATAYALAVAEGRLALERQDWSRAVTLAPLDAGNMSWNDYPEYKALTQFTVALGAARNGSVDIANAALTGLINLRDHVRDPHWVEQINIQSNIINAWIAFARGEKQQAVTLMSLASEMEWATQKHAISPGELLPARELFGDLLLELGRPKEALIQYEMSLQRSPQRLNSLYGAARSAELSKDPSKTAKYYQQFLDLVVDGDDSLIKKQLALGRLKATQV